MLDQLNLSPFLDTQFLMMSANFIGLSCYVIYALHIRSIDRPIGLKRLFSWSLIAAFAIVVASVIGAFVWIKFFRPVDGWGVLAVMGVPFATGFFLVPLCFVAVVIGNLVRSVLYFSQLDDKQKTTYLYLPLIISLVLAAISIKGKINRNTSVTDKMMARLQHGSREDLDNFFLDLGSLPPEVQQRLTTELKRTFETSNDLKMKVEILTSLRFSIYYEKEPFLSLFNELQLKMLPQPISKLNCFGLHKNICDLAKRENHMTLRKASGCLHVVEAPNNESDADIQFHHNIYSFDDCIQQAKKIATASVCEFYDLFKERSKFEWQGYVLFAVADKAGGWPYVSHKSISGSLSDCPKPAER